MVGGQLTKLWHYPPALSTESVSGGDFGYYREVLVYRRWSSKRQTAGTSSSRQEDLASTWAQRHNVTLSKRKLVDAGRSGFHGKNLEDGGALGQLLA